MTSLHAIVEPWLRGDDTDELMRLRDQLDWLRRNLFDDYEPAPYLRFDERVAAWLENVEDEADRKAMFRLLGHLFFIGKPQFKALCRGAYSASIVRWLIEEEGLQLDDPRLAEGIAGAAARTWFCPVTDSMNISSFLKANNLAGHDLRGDWRTLQQLGDPEAIRSHIACEGIERIVLLEDFVGSGDQMREVVVWARSMLPSIPLLVVPLVCCPDGLDTGARLARRYSLRFEPVLAVREDLFLLPEPVDGEPPVFGEIRDLIERVKGRLGDWTDEPFGHAETGAIFAMYTNCPDNTLPIIHEDSDRWKALFPRVRR
jgi:hypothetical protein